MNLFNRGMFWMIAGAAILWGCSESETTDFQNCQTPYARELYGGWRDENHDCQDTRTEVLIRDSQTLVSFVSELECEVFSGNWRDFYTDVLHTNPTSLEVDHLVSLKEAHDSGAWMWEESQRREYFNALEPNTHLVLTHTDINRAKGAHDPAEWLPEGLQAQESYARAWIEIKQEWGLSADSAEIAALQHILGEGHPMPILQEEMVCE